MKKTHLLLPLILFLIIGTANGQTTKVSRNWTSFVKTIDIKTEKNRKFKLQGWAKVIGHEKDTTSNSGFWVRVDNEDGEEGFFNHDKPITSSKWSIYKIEGNLTQNATKLSFGGFCYQSGGFYFDDISLFLENEKGEFELIDIENSGFENTEFKSSWNQGISEDNTTLVKDFTYSISKDAHKGKQSLLVTGVNVPRPIDYNIREEAGYSPQIGTLVSMLNGMKARVVQQVAALDQRETDHLMDEKANRIGALIMHLAASEAYYQRYTFEGTPFEKENKEWSTGLELGEKAREEYVGKPISYYLKIYDEVRAKTLEEFKKRDDAWLQESNPGSSMNHHYSWFHVMEHQSSHLGQILMMKKRIPEEQKQEVLKLKPLLDGH